MALCREVQGRVSEEAVLKLVMVWVARNWDRQRGGERTEVQREEAEDREEGDKANR